MPYFIQQPGVDFPATAWHLQRLPVNPGLDPNSAAIVSRLVTGLTSTSLTFYAFGDMPLYTAVPANQPTVRVVVAANPGPDADLLQSQFNACPMPDPNTFVPQGGTDHEAVIYQPSLHKMWEGWLWARTGRTTVNSLGQTVPEWQITWGGYESNVLTNPGYYVQDPVTGLKPGQNAAGIAQLATTITIGELIQQRVDHAIHIILPQTFTRDFGIYSSPPAQRTDGGGSDPNDPPMGAILILPRSLDLNAYPATAWDGVSTKSFWRIVAETMKEFGCVVQDTAAVATMMVEKGDTPQYPSNPYVTDPLLAAMFWAAPATVYMNNADFPWSQVQILQLHTG